MLIADPRSHRQSANSCPEPIPLDWEVKARALFAPFSLIYTLYKSHAYSWVNIPHTHSLGATPASTFLDSFENNALQELPLLDIA
jgi:hypothetical protein